jgi:hypothetical protein
MKTILDTFNKESNPEEKIKHFGTFVGGVEKIATNATGFQNMSESFEKIAASMGVFKDNLNAMDLERLTKLDHLMDSLRQMASISGGIEGLAESLATSLDKGFESLSELIQELISQSGGAIAANNVTQIQSSTPVPLRPKNESENKPQLSSTEIVDAIESLKIQIISGIKIKNLRELQM